MPKMVTGRADSIRMATTPVYWRISFDGKSFDKALRARRRWNVIRPVTMMLVETVSKLEAEAYATMLRVGLVRANFEKRKSTSSIREYWRDFTVLK